MGITEKHCNMDKAPFPITALKFMAHSIITDSIAHHIIYFLAARWPYCRMG